MRPLALVAVLVVLAGCAGDEATGVPDPTPSPTPDALAPRQVLGKDNASTCPGLFTLQAYSFTVDAGYDRIHVEFHKSGVGQMGLRILADDGRTVLDVPAETVSSQPCTHAHTGGGLMADVAPGNYQARMEGEGIFGYHLTIVEVSTRSNGTAEHGHA